jgi:ParB/RepB/Spo0J family partition protein
LRIRVDQVRTEKGFNPRSYIGEGKVRLLTQSLRSELGQISPLVLQKGSNELIDGLGRLEASKKAGQKYIEVIPANVTDEQARRMALAANALTEKLHWLEVGRAADQILSKIPRHGGRERMKKELAKEIGVATHTLEVDIVAARTLAPEAWALCLELAKKHLLRRSQIAQIWALPADKQVLLLRRLSEIPEDPIAVARHLETFLTAEPKAKNPLGRPRLMRGKSEQQKATGASVPAPPVAVQEPSDSSVKRERTEQKLQQALRMDPVDITSLETWKLAVQLAPELRMFSKLSVQRWKIIEALKADLESTQGIRQ